MPPLADPGRDHMCMNIPRVGYSCYTKLDTDLFFCHHCLTALHEIELVSTKKARVSLAQPSSSNFFTCGKEATVYALQELCVQTQVIHVCM